MRYVLSDGSAVDTDCATRRWNNVNNPYGRNILTKEDDEVLYRSMKGQYYIVYSCRGTSYARSIDFRDAARWLTDNEHALPYELINANK